MTQYLACHIINKYNQSHCGLIFNYRLQYMLPLFIYSFMHACMHASRRPKKYNFHKLVTKKEHPLISKQCHMDMWQRGQWHDMSYPCRTKELTHSWQQVKRVELRVTGFWLSFHYSESKPPCGHDTTHLTGTHP